MGVKDSIFLCVELVEGGKDEEEGGKIQYRNRVKKRGGRGGGRRGGNKERNRMEILDIID